MSNYNESADKAEKQLNNISPSMCYAKWAQASMHLTNGMTHSCYHPPLHKINVDDIKRNPAALHNTDQKKEERKQMLAGSRPAGCSYCWKIEDVGGRSDRIYRSGEYWAQNARADIFEALDTGDVDPRYLEVNFNQACNFKCMYCSPHLSTAWEEEVKEHGPYHVLDNQGAPAKHNALEYLDMPLKVANKDNPYVEAFWQWWPELYKKLEVFRITGGEPLMDANTFRVLDYIYEHPNNWLELSITSNLCPPKPELMDKFVTKLKKLEEIQIWNDPVRFNPGSGNHWYVNMAVKNFALFVSIDSVGEQAEYIRSGLHYATMQRNVLQVLNETSNTTMTFINTFNALSVPKLKEFLQYILDLRTEFSRERQGVKYIPIHDPNYKHPDYEIHPRQRVWFDVPVLRSPAWQSVQVLPKSFDKYLEEALMFMRENANTDNFAGFYDFEIDKVERNLALMRERDSLDHEKLTVDRKNFYSYFSQYDARKNLNFEKVFPEMKKFYQGCKKL
jgi:sulfatase maturation enzyme AslB (radical SAM superfamily)